jgi:hypothetical protein
MNINQTDHLLCKYIVTPECFCFANSYINCAVDLSADCTAITANRTIYQSVSAFTSAESECMSLSLENPTTPNYTTSQHLTYFTLNHSLFAINVMLPSSICRYAHIDGSTTSSGWELTLELQGDLKVMQF